MPGKPGTYHGTYSRACSSPPRNTVLFTLHAIRRQASRNRRAVGAPAIQFHFDHALGPEATQSQVFEQVMQPSIQHCIAAQQDMLFFAYGMTNAGKTYTVSGTEDSPGILPRTICEVFRLADAIPGMSIQASYLELYNDKLLDLLAACATAPGETKKRTLLRLRQSRSGATEVVGLQRVGVTNEQRALQLMHEGQAAKQTAETALNTASSRSHTVFTLKLHAEDEPGASPFFLHVVDLAGSERAGRTGAKGTRLREAARINNSLMVLHRCLSALKTDHAAATRLPVRDSKLTELFASAFTGARATQVRMLVAAAPSAQDYDETLHAVKYGDIAQSAKPIALQQHRAAQAAAQYDMNGRRVRAGSSAPQTSTAAACHEDDTASQHRPSHGHASTGDVDVEEMSLADGAPSAQEWAELRAENADLMEELEEWQAKCSEIEERVRCEVAMEMATKMAELEAQYQASADAAEDTAQEREAAAVELAARATTGRLLTRHVRRIPLELDGDSVTSSSPHSAASSRRHSSAGSASSAGQSPTAFEELQQTIRENEHEIERLHAMYASKLAELKSGLEHADVNEENARLKAELAAAQRRADAAESALLEARVQFEAQLSAMQDAMNQVQSKAYHVESHLQALSDAASPASARRPPAQRESMSSTSEFKALPPSPGMSPLLPMKRGRAQQSPGALSEATNMRQVPRSQLSKTLSSPVMSAGLVDTLSPNILLAPEVTVVKPSTVANASPTPIAHRVRRRRRTGTATTYADC